MAWHGGDDQPLSPLPLAGCKVLVVEDEVVQALDLGSLLVRCGCEVVGPTGSYAEVVRLLHHERPHLALVDMVLEDGSAMPLVERLTAADVPFLLVTAQDHDLLEHPLLRDVPRLGKPYNPRELRIIVQQLFRLDLARSLARTEQCIAQIWEHVAGQARLISRLAAAGDDTRRSEQVLLSFKETLASMTARREQILGQLALQRRQLQAMRAGPGVGGLTLHDAGGAGEGPGLAARC